MISVLLILITFTLVNFILESIIIIAIGVPIGIPIALLLLGIMRSNALFSLFRKIILRFPKLKTFEESIYRAGFTG